MKATDLILCVYLGIGIVLNLSVLFYGIYRVNKIKKEEKRWKYLS